MKRRFFCTILALALCCGLAALAEEELSGTCGENLTWTLDAEGTLTISGTGDMTDYGTHVYTEWDDAKVRNVVIEAGVTSIGDEAFNWTDDLRSVVIPDTVTRIGKYAFWTCHLTEVTIPGSVKEIDDDAFRECSFLNTVTLNQGLVRIGKAAFERTNLSSVTVPDGVTYIGDNAFSYCKNLREVSLPDSLTGIGSDVFYGCSVKIPEIVKRLEEANDLRLRDRSLARVAISFAADEIGHAAELLNATEDPDQYGWLEELTGCDYLMPLKVEIYALNEDQIAALQTAVRAETELDIPTALAEMINQQVGRTYMQLLKMLSVEDGIKNPESAYRGRNCMALLSYGQWHFIIGVYPSATVKDRQDIRGAFFSDMNAVTKLFSQLGLEPWSTYEGTAAKELVINDGTWQNDSNLMRAVYQSPERLLTLFPRLLRENTVDNSMRSRILRNYLREYPVYNANALRTIGSEYIPLLYTDYRMAYYYFTRDEYEGIKPSKYEADDSYLGTELEETPLKPDGTFRIIARVEDEYWKSNSSKNQVNCWEEFVLEAMLPASCLPENANSCDYIIYLSITWSDDKKITGGGAVLYYPTTRITVHDAKTGVMLKDAGSKTYKFVGTKMVRKSTTYWEPDTNMLLNDILKMLREEGIEEC